MASDNPDDAWDEARLKLLQQIADLNVRNRGNSEMALNLAEAYAWLTNVSQPHGGRSSVTAS